MAFNLNAQSYVGHSVDNYAGIHGVIYNPANIVASNFRADINIGSASFFGGSDYASIDFNQVINSSDEFDFDADATLSPSDNNNFFFNADAVGPSFMFNLTPKSSIGIITRGRIMFNINDINGQLYENLADGFDTNNDFGFDSPNFTGTTHGWFEIGLSYGRILMSKTNHLITGGVTLKYLQGAGVAYASTPGFSGSYTAATETLNSTGSINYGNTENFDGDDLDFEDLTGGFGLDVGFVYQWHPDRDNDNTRYFQDAYKLKIGASITDIGSISYDNAEITTYDMNATINTANAEEDIQDFLDNNYNSTSDNQNVDIQLPTALHLLVDYRLAKKWLISAQGSFSLTSAGNELSNRIINTVTIAPRFESKWLSFFTPLSFRQHGDVAFGGGLRFGPLSIGSGSVFSNLLFDESQTTDIFLGLKIPLYRK